MKSRFRGSSNVGPYTTIVGLLREHGEIDASVLDAHLVDVESSMVENYLNRLADAGAIERDGNIVRLARTEKASAS